MAITNTTTTAIVLKYFTLLIVIIPLCNSLIDIRHRFELPQIPTALKEQILLECKPTFVKFVQVHRHKVASTIKVTTASTNITVGNRTGPISRGKEVSSTLAPIINDQGCPAPVNSCILTKTEPFMEHCKVDCLTIDGKLTNDLHCWNDGCFVRATRICEEKFWRTVKAKNRKKKKKRMYCLAEIKHCYKLACLKCLGRECSMNCYGGGVQYTHLTKPRWAGYEEYKKFFPEVEDILHKMILFPEKTITIEEYDERQ